MHCWQIAFSNNLMITAMPIRQGPDQRVAPPSVIGATKKWDDVTRYGLDEMVGPMSIHGLPENFDGAFAHHLKPQVVEAFLRDCLGETVRLIKENRESRKLSEAPDEEVGAGWERGLPIGRQTPRNDPGKTGPQNILGSIFSNPSHRISCVSLWPTICFLN
jgi:hypothetical protein